MKPPPPIILLDLYGTLAENAREVGPAWRPNMAVERYRLWLVDLIRPHHVILITWRHERYRPASLEQIAEQTGWQPQEAYFRADNSRAPEFKVGIVREHVMPVHGDDPTLYLGLESNPRTRAAYARELGIKSVPVPKVGAWSELPEVEQAGQIGSVS